VPSQHSHPGPSDRFRRFIVGPVGRALLWSAAVGAGLLAATAFLFLFAFAIAYSNLPPIDTLIDYRPKIPLRVWTADNVLIG
jgi:penicillin-binding protein 1A